MPLSIAYRLKRIHLIFFLVSILFLLISAGGVHAQTIDLSGEWLSKEGLHFKAQQSGNTISLIGTSSEPLWGGITALTGTITGKTFSGRQYLMAYGCRGLDNTVPATGTVSENTIAVNFTNWRYEKDNCVRLTDKDFADTETYTHTANRSPAPTAASITKPTPSPTTPNINSSPVPKNTPVPIPAKAETRKSITPVVIATLAALGLVLAVLVRFSFINKTTATSIYNKVKSQLEQMLDNLKPSSKSK